MVKGKAKLLEDSEEPAPIESNTLKSTETDNQTSEPSSSNAEGKNKINRSDNSSNLPPHVGSRYKTRHGRQLLAVLVVLVIIAAGFGGGWLGSASYYRTDGGTTSGSSGPVRQVVLSNEGNVISGIAKNVGKSVVSVDVTSQVSPSSSEDDLFDGFSGLGGGSTTQEDAGTGIIISADGLIITNRHVIPDGTTSVSVTLSDGTQYNNVQVIGRTSDQDSLDIAFLKIQNLKGQTLTPAIIGDSAEMKVGDPVVAIGNALGQFQNTVTSGIISGYGRSVEAGSSDSGSSENLSDLFQTDAAINEGNSGGPLVNLSGQVIGINTAIASDAQNIGFAIPINDVTGLIKSVEQTGKLQQPYLGVLYIPITADVAQQYKLKVNSGAWIPPASVVGQAPVISGGPADKAGIKSGDIITKVDGTAIGQTNSLTSILDQDQVGQSVNLTVIRGGKTINVKVTLGSAPTGSTGS